MEVGNLLWKKRIISQLRKNIWPQFFSEEILPLSFI